MRKKTGNISLLIFLCIFLSGALEVPFLTFLGNSNELTDLKQINTSGEESYFKQWIENPNFTSTSYWTSSKGSLGDPNDLEANIDTTAEQANFEVIGDKRTKIIDDPINIANSGNWEKFNKTEP
ncbi:MAG: hypothetical protein ACFFAV_17425, partial [Candidatus Hermodarchaeota archaeon]